MPLDRIIISVDKKSLDPAAVAALYVELGWGTAKKYSAARIAKSTANCDIVVHARNGAGELVGIARALSDFALETKILDMVIAPEYQRAGVGRRMMQKNRIPRPRHHHLLRSRTPKRRLRHKMRLPKTTPPLRLYQTLAAAPACIHQA